ncbi:MAG TPA: metallophosphoesterase [Candidatus Binatia bacterium]|nr:metallophosphoesterase [Candidatus Binatia bacterium]
MRVAAIADVHCTRASAGTLRPLFRAAAAGADVLALCGDLTAWGLPEEAIVLARELDDLAVPVLAVLGNHDFEVGAMAEITRIVGAAGVRVLDGDAAEVRGVGFAGVKGFGGGFGAHQLQAWGEDAIKSFVQEAVAEATKLEAALAGLATPERVALLHYAPIPDTCAGEPPEIYPFLGSSRLEDPLDRLPVAAVFHGHAHAGQPEGRTRGGVPVYNVAAPVLERAFPGHLPVRVVEIGGAR